MILGQHNHFSTRIFTEILEVSKIEVNSYINTLV
jgi:hypothetical protein